MAATERIVVWAPSGEPGWELEEARPYYPRSVFGGIRTLYELAAALVVAGRRVELRGAFSPLALDEVCEAAGAWPDLPGDRRAPTVDDIVIVPEGSADPEPHARLVLSPARLVLTLLAPPGLFGWPFVAGWAPPDPLTVDLDAVARPEHFRGAAELGYELWTPAPGLKAAAEAAGVACRFMGNGVPGGYPSPARERDIDVLWLSGNRWAALARPAVGRLTELGVECVAVRGDHRTLLELFGRARVVLHPHRIEGHSRIACEARAMGAVPVVFSSNRFGVGLDEASGAVAVDTPSRLPGAVVELLDSPDRLARLSAAGMTSAREQVDWDAFVQRVDAAVGERIGGRSRAAPAAIGAALRERGAELAAKPAAHPVADEGTRVELELHRQWLDEMRGSLSWRVTAPLRAAKRALARDEGSPSDAHPDRPRGAVEWPPAGTECARGPVAVHGWCLFPRSSVARVEVRVGGGPPALARIAVERPGGPPDADHPDAPIAGFGHKTDLAALPSGMTTVRVEVVARALDGRSFALESMEYPVAPAQEPRLDRPTNGATRAPAAQRPHGVRQDGRTRVLVFTHALNYGGASLYVVELLRRLRRTARIDCEVVALADGPMRDELEEVAVPVHLADAHSPHSAARYEDHMAELTAWSARRGFDVVLVNSLSSFAGADLATRLGLPAVWAIHESFPLPMFWFNAFPPPTLDPRVRERAERALRSAAALVFMADATRRLFASDAEPDRLVTLPYGVELEEIDAARRALGSAATRRRLGLDEGARVVLCLGTVEPRKSQALLAQAFAQLAGRHPDAQLVLVGATEEAYSAGYRAALTDYVARAGLEARVRVEPVTGDPFSWHAVADVLVCASDIESMPRSVTEAMAFGTPVLSTRVFGVPELIDDGVDGFLCEPRDAASLAAGLDRVLTTDPDELAAVARRGFERVRARHDPTVHAAAVLRLLEGLAADPGALPGNLLGAGAPAPAAAAGPRY